MGKTFSRWNLRTPFCGSSILMTSDEQFSGFRRRRRQNINSGRDHSTWNPTGSGFLHKWPEPAQNVSEAGAKNAPRPKNVAQITAHEIPQAVVSYINGQNPDTLCTDFQVPKMFQGLGSGRPRRINMTCRTDDST